MTDPIPWDPRYPQGFCPRHRVPLGPDGSCLVCAAARSPSRLQLGLIYGFAALALGGGGFLVLHMWRQMEEHREAPPRESEPADDESRRAQAGPDAAAIAVVEEPSAGRDSAARARRIPRARAHRGTAGSPRHAGSETARGIVLDPSPPERRVVVRPVSVTMYMTRWCPHCTRARSFLRSQKIPFREVNVERDKAGAAELRQLNPRGGVPTFNIDGRVMVGFSPAALATAVEMAKERRAHGAITVE